MTRAITKNAVGRAKDPFFDPAFHVPQPLDDSAVNTVRNKIRAWIFSDSFMDLLTLFHGDTPKVGSLDSVITELEKFSDRWDFRRIARERGAATDDKSQEAGAARWLSATAELTSENERRVLTDVAHLGLVQALDPSESEYDYVFVLGGARLSCQLRPMRAAELVRAGLRTATVALLGAARPIPDSERDATNTYAPGAMTEFDLIIAGAQHAFGFDSGVFKESRFDSPEKNLSWVVRSFHGACGRHHLTFKAVSAPSSDPVRRANSADTMIFLLRQENIKQGARILLITSQIYVPYVQLEALRTIALPYKIHVETIGFPGDRIPELHGLSSVNHYLQEIRSAIQAARRFCTAFPDPTSRV